MCACALSDVVVELLKPLLADVPSHLLSSVRCPHSLSFVPEPTCTHARANRHWAQPTGSFITTYQRQLFHICKGPLFAPVIAIIYIPWALFFIFLVRTGSTLFIASAFFVSRLACTVHKFSPSRPFIFHSHRHSHDFTFSRHRSSSGRRCPLSRRWI